MPKITTSTATCPTVDLKRPKLYQGKPKVAFYSLTSCEGCQFAILDLGQKLLDLTKKIDIVQMRLIEEEVDRAKYYDIAIIEGAPIERTNFALVKKVRRKARFLIAIGACANLGNFMRIKNWRDKQKLMDYVYKCSAKLNNPDVYPVEKVVKVDFKIPGCPPNAEDFLQAIYNLLTGKNPYMPKRPVCYECQVNEYECILQKWSKNGGQVCFGPLAQGGCDAICLKSKMPCWACRGLIEGDEINNTENLFKVLKEYHTDHEIEMAMEVFGVKDDIQARFPKVEKLTHIRQPAEKGTKPKIDNI
jgi:sulfhydrogenase subunit delta